jgi:uncharacterized membrane protein YuzA (DUF378 family)
VNKNEKARCTRRGARAGRRPQLGLVAVAKFDLVAAVFGLAFGETNAGSRVIYGLVGLAAVYGIGSLLRNRRRLEGTRPAPAAVSH